MLTDEVATAEKRLVYENDKQLLLNVLSARLLFVSATIARLSARNDLSRARNSCQVPGMKLSDRNAVVYIHTSGRLLCTVKIYNFAMTQQIQSAFAFEIGFCNDLYSVRYVCVLLELRSLSCLKHNLVPFGISVI